MQALTENSGQCWRRLVGIVGDSLAIFDLSGDYFRRTSIWSPRLRVSRAFSATTSVESTNANCAAFLLLKVFLAANTQEFKTTSPAAIQLKLREPMRTSYTLTRSGCIQFVK